MNSLLLIAASLSISAWAEPMIHSAEDCFQRGMHFIQLQDTIAVPRQEAFDFYVAVNPADVIGSNAISKFKGDWTGLHNGLLYENDLRYFLLRFPLDIRFTEIEPDSHLIRFWYVNAPSTGFQEIQLLEDGGETRVVHNTCYKGNSRFIDFFYPNVHKKVLWPLHRNSKLSLELAHQTGMSALEISKHIKERKFRRRLKHSRGPASLTPSEWNEFAHRSEGSDIFPYDWWIRLKSARDRDLTHTWNAKITEGLAARTGAIADPDSGPYVSDAIGLSVTWSNHSPEQADALKTDPETAKDRMGMRPEIRYINHEPSIRMIGASCAACHTGAIRTASQTYLVPGGQANVSLDRFFRDMILSTLALTINFEDQLTQFLMAFDYPQAEAASIAQAFAKQTLKQGKLGTKLKLLMKKLKLVADLPDWTLIHEEQNLALQFKRLLRLTLHLPPDAPLGNELERRMNFFAKFATGTPKWTYQDGYWTRFHETKSGYGRIDAFINAFNITLRDKRERVDISAPLGFPPIWGIENKKLIHQTGNTNSVLLRNVGQAMGGGAILLDDQFNSTVNIHNLHRLEKLMYKIDAPEWEKMFAQETSPAYRIDYARADRGRTLFTQECARCHLPQSIDRQYAKPLYDYGLFKQSEIGTDPELAEQIVKPVHPLEDRASFPRPYYLMETQGIVDAYFKRFGIAPAQASEFMFERYRGKEWYRDTKLEQPENSYSTRDLSGIWATAPFLHNNSVPTLWDLLQKAEDRPVVFKVGLQEFDPAKVGALHPELGLRLCQKPNRKDFRWDIYQCIDTRLRGNSNAGHEFGTDLSPDQKWDLIEYLKVLKPYQPDGEAGRGPASVPAQGEEPTPFLDAFDHIELSGLPLVGNFFYRKDLLRHRLRVMNRWVLDDPHAMFAELRAHRPIAFMSSIPIRGFKDPNTGVVLITRYDDVIEVLSHPAEFSVRHNSYKFGLWGGHMLSTDEGRFNTVEKPWMRKLMPPQDLPRIQNLVETLTQEALAKNNHLNLVRDIARWVPIQLSKKYFGYPGPDLKTMYRWSYTMQRDAFHNPTNKRRIRKQALQSAEEMKQYSSELIAETRKKLQQNGSKVVDDTILERILLSPEVSTQEITDDRAGINILATLVAGVETMQAAVVNSLEYLLDHPEPLALARDAAAKNDLGALNRVLLEALRFNPINPMLLRYTETDTWIARGTERETLIPAGTSVLVATQSAMFDESNVTEPHLFKTDRTGFEYLHFGYGHHRCLGEMVASIELPVILKNLLLKKNLRIVLNDDVKGMPFPENRWIEFDRD